MSCQNTHTHTHTHIYIYITHTHTTFTKKQRSDEMRQGKDEKQLTTSPTATYLTAYGVYSTCFIANHAISAKSHLIEWVGSL